MPTGYTAGIEKGITFEQYVMTCARAFGALVLMRDEPDDAKIPEVFEPEPYYRDRVAEARARLERLRSFTSEQASAQANVEFQQATDRASERQQAMIALREKYEEMLAKVLAWEPPSEEHTNLKKFMRDQIEESMKFDCYYIEPPQRRSGEVWLREEIDRAEQAIHRAASRNLWLTQLRQSLRPKP